MKEEIEKRLNGECEVKEISIQKNNGVVKNGYVINKKGSKVGCTVYTDGIPEDKIVDHVVKVFNEHKDEVPTESVVKNILNPDFVKEHVFPVLVNHDKNVDRLDTVVHRDYLGLEIFYRLMVGDNSTVLVENKLLEVVGITADELHDCAMDNIDNYAEAFNFMFDAPMVIMTLHDKVLGSGAIFSKKVINDVHRRFEGKDFFLIPSSVDEWIAVPVYADIDTLATKNHLIKTLREVNRTLADEDFLSDTLYFCCDGIVEVA